MSDKDKLEKAVKLADAMYHAAQYLTTDASRLRRAMDAYHQFIITEYNKQEPASEDLIDASNNYCLTIRKGYPRVKDKTDVFICNAFEAGAQWQKEQMMKGAIDAHIIAIGQNAVVKEENEDDFRKCLSKFQDGDKVKVIIIKE